MMCIPSVVESSSSSYYPYSRQTGTGIAGLRLPSRLHTPLPGGRALASDGDRPITRTDPLTAGRARCVVH